MVKQEGVRSLTGSWSGRQETFEVVLLRDDRGRYSGAEVRSPNAARGWLRIAFEYKFGGTRVLPPEQSPVNSDCDFSYHADADAACEQAIYQFVWEGIPGDFDDLLDSV